MTRRGGQTHGSERKTSVAEGLPQFAVSACTTYHSTFVEDLANCRALSISGIGLWEYKLPEDRDDETIARFRESGLTATFCFPNVPGIIHGDELFSQPMDRKERLALVKAGIRRLARFNPVAVACLAGPPRDIDIRTARSWVVEGLREAAYVAGESGVRLALEVIRPGPGGSLASTIPEAAELIADIGAENMSVIIDTWHFWDSPQALADIRANGDIILGVQVNDHSPRAQGWWDRVLPGDGEMDLKAILQALRDSGFRGWYELEIFSDDGTFGHDLPDSLWRRDPIELLRAGRDSFERVWRESLKVGRASAGRS
jgi:sugar phosphate isomerase/epimerase